MGLLATCPKDPEHKRFATVAHVSEDWIVDEHGQFIEVCTTGEVVAAPRRGNIWTCIKCGAEATVIREHTA